MRTTTWGPWALIAGTAALTVGFVQTLPAQALTEPRAVIVRAAIPPSCPQIISHKGAGALTPENTVAGIHAAHDRQNTSITEVDIRFNKSNFAWAMHNSDLAINTDGTGQITDKWFGDMGAVSYADYPPFNGQAQWAGYLPDGKPRTKIPYSYEILQAAKQEGTRLLFDVKVTPTRAQADSLVGDYMNRPELAMADQVSWMANTTGGLVVMREWYPDLDYWLIDSPAATQFGRTGEYLTSIGASTIVIPHTNVTVDLVAYYHRYSIKVGEWATSSAATDAPAVWAAMRAAQVDYIITDRGADAVAAQAADCGPSPLGAGRGR